MLLADVSFSNESLIAIGVQFAALAGAIRYIFKLLIDAHNREVALALEKGRTKTYQDMVDDSMAVLEVRLQKAGVSIPRAIAPVVPESQSPTKPEDEATAELATRRARLTALVMAAGLPAREAHPRADGTIPVQRVPSTPTAIVTEQLREDIAIVGEKVDNVKEILNEGKPPEQDQSPEQGETK